MNRRSRNERSDRIGREEDREGTGNDHQHDHEQRLAPANGCDVLDLETCREKNEQAGDQEITKGLLELDDVLDGDELLICERDTHQGHRQQPRLGSKQVRGDKRSHHEHEGGSRLEVVGDQVLLEKEHHHRCPDQTHDQTHPDRGYRCAEAPAETPLADNQDVEDDDCQRCSDRVDQDSLPVQDGPHVSGRLDRTEERPNDSGTGDDDHGPQKDGDPGFQSEHYDGDARSDPPCDQDADRDEAPNNRAMASDLGNPERGSSLEQHHGDGERHTDEEDLSEHLVRLDEACDGACHEAKDQQEENRRNPQPGGDPLSTDPEDEHHRDPDEQFGMGHENSIPCASGRSPPQLMVVVWRLM